MGDGASYYSACGEMIARIHASGKRITTVVTRGPHADVLNTNGTRVEVVEAPYKIISSLQWMEDRKIIEA